MVFARHSAPVTISPLLELNKRLYEGLLVRFEASDFYVPVVVVDVTVVLFCISYIPAPRVRSSGSKERKKVSATWHPRHPRGVWKTWSEGFFLPQAPPTLRIHIVLMRETVLNLWETLQTREKEEIGKRTRFSFCVPKVHWGCIPRPVPRTRRAEGHPTWIHLPNSWVHTALAIRLLLPPPHGSAPASLTLCLPRLLGTPHSRG